MLVCTTSCCIILLSILNAVSVHAISKKDWATFVLPSDKLSCMHQNDGQFNINVWGKKNRIMLLRTLDQRIEFIQNIEKIETSALNSFCEADNFFQAHKSG